MYKNNVLFNFRASNWLKGACDDVDDDRSGQVVQTNSPEKSKPPPNIKIEEGENTKKEEGVTERKTGESTKRKAGESTKRKAGGSTRSCGDKSENFQSRKGRTRKNEQG